MYLFHYILKVLNTYILCLNRYFQGISFEELQQFLVALWIRELVEYEWLFLLRLFLPHLHQFVVVLVIVVIGLHLGDGEEFEGRLWCALGRACCLYDYFFLSASLLGSRWWHNCLDHFRTWLLDLHWLGWLFLILPFFL
jgi:hypothetical protein